MPKTNWNERMLADMASVRTQQRGKIPEGFKTTQQWVKELGISENSVRRRIVVLTRAGKWEMKLIHLDMPGGWRRVPHYGPAQKGGGK